jgi:hypothetical protein
LATPFFHDVPVLEDIPIGRIMKLRKSEGPAFELYRDSVVKSVRASKGEARKRQHEIFNDVIRPELTKLETSIRRSRKLLRQSVSQDLILAAGAVAIGVFGNFLPPELRMGVGGLGGVHYSTRLVRSMSKLISEPKEALDSRYYFLWKAKTRPVWGKEK